MASPKPPPGSWQEWLTNVVKLWTDPQTNNYFQQSLDSQRVEQQNFQNFWDLGSNRSESSCSLSRNHITSTYEYRIAANPGECERRISAALENYVVLDSGVLYAGDISAEEAAELADELAELRRYRRAEQRSAAATLEDELDPAEQPQAAKAYKPTVAGCVPSRIVFCALIIVIGMQQLAGASLPFGFSESTWPNLPDAPLPSHPEKGDFFKDRAQEISDVDAVLQQALPISWQGMAADDYAEANTEFLAIAQRLAQLDQTMQRYVDEQAAHITQTQFGLGIEQDALIAAYVWIRWLESAPTTLIMAFKRAVEISLASVIACLGVLGDCLDHSRRRADRATAIDYAGITRAAQQRNACSWLAPTSGMPRGQFGARRPPYPTSISSPGGPLPGVTFDLDELHQLANRHNQAAAQASSRIKQTAHEFSKKVHDTHGVISGPSSNAFATKARQRERAGDALNLVALTFSATLRSAAVSYLRTDVSAATNLAQRCRDTV